MLRNGKNQEIRVYSEISRDDKLAVSVAYVGESDLKTSHSTVEIRRVILEFNLPFGIRIDYFRLYKPAYYGLFDHKKRFYQII